MSIRFLVEESKRLLKQAQDECPHNVITRTIYAHTWLSSANEICEECGLSGNNIRGKTPSEVPSAEQNKKRK